MGRNDPLNRFKFHHDNTSKCSSHKQHCTAALLLSLFVTSHPPVVPTQNWLQSSPQLYKCWKLRMRILCFLFPFSGSSPSLRSSLPLLSGDVSCIGAPGGGVKGPGHIRGGGRRATSTGSFGQQASQAREQVHVLEKPLYIDQVLQQWAQVGLRQWSPGVGLIQVKLVGWGGGGGEEEMEERELVRE